MKKLLKKWTAAFLTILMLFSATGVCTVSAEEKYPYRNYTFDQFYAMSDEELKDIFRECGVDAEMDGFITIYFYQEEKVPHEALSFGTLLDEEVTSFCDAVGIPAQYVQRIRYKYLEEKSEWEDKSYHCYYDSDLQELREPIKLHWEYTIVLRDEYQTQTFNAENQKTIKILMTMLYLNPNICVNRSANQLCGPISVYGDVCADGVVDLRDAVFLSKYMVGSVEINTNPIFADLNSDGSVNEKDLLLILQFLVGLIDTLPYSES